MTVLLHDLLPVELRRSWAVDGTCPDLDLYSLYRSHQIADPHRTSVIDAKGAVCYTALDRKVRCLAAGLSGLGIRPGDVVGVQLPNGRNTVIAELALAALGAIALPFPVGRGDREAVSLLARSEAVAVIAVADHRGNHHAADLLARAGELPHLLTVVAVGPGTIPEGAVPWAELLRTDPTAYVPARPDPDAAARILVSSGSEAEPKMVAYSHNALAGGRGNFLASLMKDGQPPRCLFLVPLGSAFGSSGTAVALARHGGTLVLLDHFTPEGALDAIVAHLPTHVLGVPTMIRMMLDRLAERGRWEFTAPTALVVGGSPLDAATAEEAAPRVRLSRGEPLRLGRRRQLPYGSGGRAGTGRGARRARGPSGPAGRGHPHRRSRRGRGGMEEAPRGSVGEIVARGPMTPLCYVAAPELDARYRTADGWVRTGDLGRMEEDGTLRIVGRLKDVVIRGGANISPAEVELELATHPDVRDVVCVGVPDPLMGERLAACVVPRGGKRPALGELSAHLDARGLERRKHPELLLLVDELPLTPAGKPDPEGVAGAMRGARAAGRVTDVAVAVRRRFGRPPPRSAPGSGAGHPLLHYGRRVLVDGQQVEVLVRVVDDLDLLGAGVREHGAGRHVDVVQDQGGLLPRQLGQLLRRHRVGPVRADDLRARHLRRPGGEHLGDHDGRLAAGPRGLQVLLERAVFGVEGGFPPGGRVLRAEELAEARDLRRRLVGVVVEIHLDQLRLRTGGLLDLRGVRFERRVQHEVGACDGREVGRLRVVVGGVVHRRRDDDLDVLRARGLGERTFPGGGGDHDRRALLLAVGRRGGALGGCAA